MKKYIKYYKILFFVLASLLLFSCEDSPPSEYIKKYYVEAYIYVGEPIRNIKVLFTQPVSDSFNYKNSFIKDAEVFIISGSQKFNLKYDFENNSGYYYEDSTYKIQPSKEYSIEIKLKDGSLMKGLTTTPETTKWIKQLPKEIYYPKDTLNLPPVDSLHITWQKTNGFPIYLVSTKCLDTLEYGKYLSPPTEEKNRRIIRPWERGGQEYNETTRWGFITNNTSPVVWASLKWYGLTKLRIYVPDFNFLRYFIQYQRKAQYDPLLSNIEGDGFGIFASASYIESTFFVIKNRE